MTAEIVVLNKDAVALAADSIVTVAGQKIYHTTNKLFSLSEYHPVGVMIYGSAEIGGIPWETLIKLYRARLGKNGFPSLDKYKEDFINFLESEITQYDEQLEEEILEDYVDEYCDVLKSELDQLVEAEIEAAGSITLNKTKRYLYGLITEHTKNWESEPFIEFCDVKLRDYVAQKHAEKIEAAVIAALDEYNVSKARVSEIAAICANIFCKKSLNVTGLVIAGFGENQLFPSYNECKIECVIGGRIKRTEGSFEIQNSEFNDACVVPFAQTGVVHTFMRGISPEMLDDINGFMLNSSAELIFETRQKLVAAGVAQKIVDQCVPTVENHLTKLNEEFMEHVQSSAYDEHIHPIISAVAYLPKNELAEMAESLVSITSFKQKVSLQRESVGGLIDVAVISKSDGFVWIKRKHYFDAALNPMHMRRYNRE